MCNIHFQDAGLYGHASANTTGYKPEQKRREHERLLGTPDVCEMTGFGYATAAKFMRESGCSFKVHSQLFVLESSFFQYLHSLEASNSCNR